MTKKTFLLTCLLGMFAPGARAHLYTPEHVSVLTKENGDSIMTIPINSSSYNLTLNPYENSVVTLNGRNCLPQILPTYLQNFTLQGSRYLIVSDMTCGKNIRTGDEGNVVFEQGSVTEIEKSGNLILSPGTIVKSGATLRVKQSNINF